jgi:DNA-binding transcriptional regulator YiaG
MNRFVMCKSLSGVDIKAMRKRLGLSLFELAWQAKVKPELLELIETDRLVGGECKDRVMMFLGLVSAESKKPH